VISIRTGLRGMYKIEAVKPDGSRRLLADWFSNLITDNGLELIGTTGGYFGYCSVGSGNATPNNSDTALQTLVGTTSTLTTVTNVAQSTSPYFGTISLTYRFAAGVATGNLAEVGIGYDPTGISLFSRALIVDSLGSPTTITVLSTEALDVTYQLRLYVPTADVTGTVVISGTSYGYTLRAANATSASDWSPVQYSNIGGASQLTVGQGTIGGVTVLPTYSDSTTGSSPVLQTYGAGNHYLDAITTFGLTEGNVVGGINALDYSCGQTFGRLGRFQIQLSASIPKDASHTLTLTVRHTWGRYP
jgi:hypothetical protein